jgi:hypothetical protein
MHASGKDARFFLQVNSELAARPHKLILQEINWLMQSSIIAVINLQARFGAYSSLNTFNNSNNYPISSATLLEVLIRRNMVHVLLAQSNGFFY